MKLSYSKKILLLSVFVFLCVLILNVFFTNTLLSRIIGINDKIKQITLSSQERERNFQLQDSVASSKAERAELEKYFVERGDAKTAEFISELESLARKSALSAEVRSVNYASAAETNSSETVSAVKFKLSVVGKWSDVLNFVGKIENLPKAVLVDGVSLEVNSKSWSADISFSVAKLLN